ncbi:18.1 kDa class I heat shock protein-like [Vicia villosa]|uniref:18.1 kDa class I heat shock protein-like n=1 Tax=Vicia villosa TaxID=3911 RepID=UPI00273B446B|nr:18.1 kDa class I heat shock protein-like [Vicia villosa]XP_058766552.1 18.1 kDa class I heat shock protein-like [Vicia villosa]
MSLFPNSIFGRKRSKSPQDHHHHHQTWNNHPSYQTHGYEVSHPKNPHITPPTFYEPSPIVNTTHIEWKETPEAHVYKAHLPGMKRSDVRVEVDDDRMLCIICEKSVEKEEQRGGWHRVEVASGHFVQRLTLPENSNVDHVKAYMDNGVLTVNVPKSRVGNKHVRSVQISHV